MTGILPIKKYGTHSALNMFSEYSILTPKTLKEFVGFKESEVIKLCKKYQMDIEQMKLWYDGYHINAESYYCPKSVVEAITEKEFLSYWT